MCSIIGVGERLHKVLGQVDLGTLDSGERSLPFELLVYYYYYYYFFFFFFFFLRIVCLLLAILLGKSYSFST